MVYSLNTKPLLQNIYIDLAISFKTTPILLMVSLQYKDESVPKAYENDLRDIVDRDPLAPLFEQDKELVWRFRFFLHEKLPSSLPKLLNSVKWSQHKDVAVVWHTD